MVLFAFGCCFIGLFDCVGFAVVRLIMWLLCGLVLFDLIWWLVGSFDGLVLLIAFVVVVICLVIGLRFGFLCTDFGCAG